MWFQPKFQDRVEAGRVLAGELKNYEGLDDVVVLGLPRGGVPVAFEVARSIKAPLDVFIVRKLGVPGQEELALGAIASGGVRVLNEDLVKALRIPDEVIDRIAQRETIELGRREQLYRAGRPALTVGNKTVIVVDDGLATGATMRAAVTALKLMRPNKIIVAVPVAARQTCDEFKHEADVWTICAVTPEPFYGVGMWYSDFSQTTDEEVRQLLAEAAGGQQFSTANGKGG